MTTLETILIVLGAVTLLWIGYIAGKKAGALLSDRKWRQDLPRIREDAAKRSRAVLGGQFSEQLAPYLPDFPWRPTEARFLGKPVDFLVFKGLEEKAVSEVVFVEVKSGTSRLNTVEKSLKEAIQTKKVSWEEYRIPQDVTTGNKP
ncbi:hypothetical protein KY327_03610 [Candidatus Woesearchaeota archaeon]|nr:hypothetical protein [Candidatus Woesearchaeota archaeon]